MVLWGLSSSTNVNVTGPDAYAHDHASEIEVGKFHDKSLRKDGKCQRSCLWGNRLLENNRLRENQLAGCIRTVNGSRVRTWLAEELARCTRNNNENEKHDNPNAIPLYLCELTFNRKVQYQKSQPSHRDENVIMLWRTRERISKWTTSKEPKN